MRIKFLHTVLESLTPGSYPEYVNRIFSISLYIAVEKVPPDLFVCFFVFFLITLYSRSQEHMMHVQLEREEDIRRLLSRCTDT